MAKCSTAECQAGPQRDRISGIGGNRRDARKQQSRECNEAPTARYSIQRPAQQGGKKQKNCILQVKVDGNQT